MSKNHRRRHFSGLCHESKVAQRPRFRGTGRPQIRPPRPSEAEVLPEGLDVFLGVLGGHVGVVWRAKRAAGWAASEASLLPEVMLFIRMKKNLKNCWIFF